MATLLMKPLFVPSAGVVSGEGPAAGEPGAAAPGAGVGVSSEAVGDGVGEATGAGVGAVEGDGDGVEVGGATGAGVGEAVGETVGAPDGACAMQEVAKSAKRRKSLTPCDEAINARCRERKERDDPVRFAGLEMDKGRLESEDIYKKERERD